MVISSLDLSFEWDEEKNKINFYKHGITFEQAKEIFQNEHTIIQGNSELEDRKIAIGVYREVLFLAIIFTPRNKKIRIISARRAKVKEINLYKAFYKSK